MQLPIDTSDNFPDSGTKRIDDHTQGRSHVGAGEEAISADGAVLPAASRPGWSEMVVGLIAYGLAFGAVFLILKVIPDELSVLGGVIALVLSGTMGLAAFAAAYAIKRRGLATFGLRKASWKSLLLGAGLGVVCWTLGTLVSLITYSVNGGIENVQGDYQAAAAGGSARGHRHGDHGFAHGINPVLPVAFIVGIVNGILFHRTGSVWPGAVVHAFNNAFAAFVPVVLAALLG